jgi:phenylacetate-CoA ligase
MGLVDLGQHSFDSLSSCWDRATPTTTQLADWQLGRAWAVAERLVKSNPFYAKWIGELPKGRTAEDFRSLPVTLKKDVCDDCAAYPPYGSRTTCPPEDIRHFVETSGTSGKGREVYALDATDEIDVYRAEAVGFYWAGVRAGSKVLLTLPVGLTAAGLWYYGGLRLLGANVMSAGAYPTDRKVSALRRYGADVIIGTPSYLQRLAMACEEEGVDPASLGVKSLVVAGESYTVEWAAAIQKQWGATLYEQYGCTQRAIAWTCPGGVLQNGKLGTLHFLAEFSYCEVIDPATQQPARPGQFGEIIVTPLQAGASPLLRFATRDRIELVGAGECSCGRMLPGIRAGSVQRYDDMLKIKGVNVWPAAFDVAIFGVPGVLNYQGNVRRHSDGSELVEVIVECVPDSSADVTRHVTDAIRKNLGLGVDVQAVSPGEITRTVPEGFLKLQRWRDLRQGSTEKPPLAAHQQQTV